MPNGQDIFGRPRGRRLFPWESEVIPMGATSYLDAPGRGVATPSVADEPQLAPAPQLGPVGQYRQANPRPEFMAPAPMGRGRALAGALATFAAGIGSPEAGARVGQQVFHGPYERARQRYEQESAQYQRGLEDAYSQAGEGRAQAGERRAERADIRAETRLERELAPAPGLDKKLDEYTNDKGERVLILQKADGSIHERNFGKVREPSKSVSSFNQWLRAFQEENKREPNTDEVLGFVRSGRSVVRITPSQQVGIQQWVAAQIENIAREESLLGTTKGRREANERGITPTSIASRKLRLQETYNSISKKMRLPERTLFDEIPVGGEGTAQGTVKMRAPNGQIKEVPRDQVEAFKAKGAVIVE